MIGFVGRSRNEALKPERRENCCSSCWNNVGWSFERGFGSRPFAAESIKYVGNNLIHEAVLLLVIVAN